MVLSRHMKTSLRSMASHITTQIHYLRNGVNEMIGIDEYAYYLYDVEKQEYYSGPWRTKGAGKSAMKTSWYRPRKGSRLFEVHRFKLVRDESWKEEWDA